MSKFFTSGGQSIGASASASVIPMNIQDWFPLGFDCFDFLPVQGILKSPLLHRSSKESILLRSALFMAQLSHPYINLVTQSCLSLCDPMDWSMPGFPVHHQLLELTQAHVHWVGDGIQPSHPLSSPSPPAFNLSQHQGLFQWVNSLHQVAKLLELQHQSFQWTFRTDFL